MLYCVHRAGDNVIVFCRQTHTFSNVLTIYPALGVFIFASTRKDLMKSDVTSSYTT
jgi:hypothetical protein